MAKSGNRRCFREIDGHKKRELKQVALGSLLILTSCNLVQMVSCWEFVFRTDPRMRWKSAEACVVAAILEILA